MKTKKQSWAFSKKELEILKQIAQCNQELTQIERNLQIKPNLLSYHLKMLQEKGIVKVNRLSHTQQRSKSRKTVAFANRKHSLLLKKLFTDDNFPLKWEDVLSGRGMEVLFQITSCPCHAQAISNATFWRYCKKLRTPRVITLNDTGHYQINDSLFTLKGFIKEYQAYAAEKMLENVPGNPKIIWQKGSEFLIKVPKGTIIAQTGFQKTGTSFLSIHRIVCFEDFDVYFYSNSSEKICLEETILHVLLTERGNAKYSTYSYLLLNKELRNIDEDLLIRMAEWYDLSFQTNQLLKIVKL